MPLKPKPADVNPWRSALFCGICIFFGGIAGTLTRWGIDRVTLRFSNNYFTWSSLTFGVISVNLLAAFLLGYFKTSVDRADTRVHRLILPIKLGITTGFLGAFSTFSALGIAAVSGELSFANSDLWAMGGKFCFTSILGLILLVVGVLCVDLGSRLAGKDLPAECSNWDAEKRHCE